MTAPLKIGTNSHAKTFALPLDLVTKTVAILAQKRVGKSYAAAVITEELLDAGQVPVVIDYTGAHWGLKSSADGNKAGYPVVVFGGDHADIPLESGAGEVVANAIVENRFPAIIDLTLFRKGEALRFLAPFFETIYRRNREPLHLICDEADAYAPQKPFGEDARTLGAMQDIVRRGGIRGIGCTLITQRPAVLNKDVLTQCELLVAMRLMHPRDINAIEEWVAVHADSAGLAKMKADLPTLPRGTAYFWSPAMEIFEKVQIRERRTFDSGATPKAGQKVQAPRQLAAVDVAKLGEQISATVARAKDNDPAALKAKIRELEAALKKAPAAAPTPEPVRIEVPVIARDDMVAINGFMELMRGVNGSLPKAMAALQAVADRQQHYSALRPPTAKPLISSPPYYAALRSLKPESAGSPGPCDIGSGGKRRILIALAQYPDGMGARRLSLLTGIAARGGTWRTYLGELRSANYVDGGGDHMVITDSGRSALGPYDPLPTDSALREYWRQRLGDSGKRRIFDVVVAAYPRALSYDEVSRETGIEMNGGTWRTYLGELRGLELIEGRGDLKASDDLFE